MTENISAPSATAALQTNGSCFLVKTGEANVTATQQTCVDYGALQSPLAVLYAIIFVLGLVGNLAALLVFFCVHAKKNSVRVFLINIAFADLLLVVCLPFRILYHSQGNVWTLGPTLCKVVGNLFYMNMYISVTLLGLISVDRYLKIHRGARVQRRLRSTRWSAGLCAVVWIVAFALTFVFLMSKNHSQLDRCFHYKVLQKAKWKAYVNMCIVAVFWLVFIALVVSYGKIALTLLRASQEKPDLPNASRYARTARKSFVILVLFTVCFVPYHLVRVFYIRTQIADTSCFWRGVADKANEVALLFSALNSCLDPVMYFLLSSSVRKEALRLVGGVFRVRDVGGVSGSSSSVELDGKSGRASRGPAGASLSGRLREKTTTESSQAGM